jgi:hypothetical protein
VTPVILLITDENELIHVHRALADHVSRWGIEGNLPGVVVAVDELAVMLKRSPSLAAMSLAMAESFSESELMTYSAVGERLDLSESTIRRMVKRGELDKVGRRITRASVQRVITHGIK